MHQHPATKGYPLLPLIGALLLAGILGYLIGRTVAVRAAFQASPVQVREQAHPLEPTVVLEGVRDGKVIGSVKGEVRLWIGEKQVFPDEEGKFAAEPGPLLVNDISVLTPEGMQFVASKRGEKYYPVRSGEAQRIALENRVYFESALQAEGAGYRK